MWIDPGSRLVEATIYKGIPASKHVAFFYEFKPGYEYKLVCDLSVAGKKVTTGTGVSTINVFDGVNNDCYFYRKTHDEKAYDSNHRDHILHMKEDIE